ncbi:MAG: hypothetical protein Q7R95_00125 [bacterium]|nr:hypothetical protein [bacterium]
MIEKYKSLMQPDPEAKYKNKRENTGVPLHYKINSKGRRVNCRGTGKPPEMVENSYRCEYFYDEIDSNGLVIDKGCYTKYIFAPKRSGIGHEWKEIKTAQ